MSPEPTKEKKDSWLKRDESNTNSGGDNIEGVRDYQHTFKRDMEAFDKLSPRVRKFINEEMIVEWSALHTLQYQMMHKMSDATIIEMLKNSNEMLKAKLRIQTEKDLKK